MNFGTHSGFLRSSILDKYKRLGLPESCKELDNLILCQERWNVGNAQLVDGIGYNVGDDVGVVRDLLGHSRHNIVARAADLKTTRLSIGSAVCIVSLHGSTIQRKGNSGFRGFSEL